MCQFCLGLGKDFHASAPVSFEATTTGGATLQGDGVSSGSSASELEASVVGVSSSGNTYIDAILIGYGKWSGQVTYSFPSSTTAYNGSYAVSVDGFQQVSATQINAIQAILEGASSGYGSVEAVCDLDFARVADNTVRSSVNIQVAQCDNFGGSNLSTARVADFPGSPIYPSFPDAAGDVWFGDDSGNGTDNGAQGYRSPILGNYYWATHIHELGHALGLKHSHNPDGTFGQVLPSDRESVEFSVMSYKSYNGSTQGSYTNEQFGYAQTFMMYDILALQYLYGADYTTNSGNTTYTWSPTTGQMFLNGAGQGAPGANRIFLTIWDGGGTDTYDMSNYSSSVSIDLRPEMWSITSTAQLADLDAFSSDASRIAHGNVYNAALFSGDTRSLIENANGGSGNDTLVGNDANNQLDGRGGVDVMSGGAGNDIYFIDNASDQAVENAGEGFDTIFSSTTFTIGINIEALSLTGSANISGFGNSLNNFIYGNSGNNQIDGGAGLDSMYGGQGDDIFYFHQTGDQAFENANEGFDTVFSDATFGLAVSSSIEALALTGSANLNAFGNSINNFIYGNSGHNQLDGMGGSDAMYGGAGNDIYYIHEVGDKVKETVNAGFDTIFADISIGPAVTSSSSIEGLALMGNANLNVFGNASDNFLYGNSGNNYLDGGAGSDAMYGGAGDDIYAVHEMADQAVEDANAGFDSVFSDISFTLALNVEALSLVGSAHISATGSASGNFIYGNAGSNIIDGRGGSDVLSGGLGNDTFVFRAGEASGDRIMDFNGNDASAGDVIHFIDYGVGATFTSIDSTHWQISYNSGASFEDITFANAASIHSSDFVFV